MDIGLAIKMRRTAKRVKSKELADRIGIDKAYMSRLERNIYPVSVKRLEIIAQALGTTSEQLIMDAKELSRNEL